MSRFSFKLPDLGEGTVEAEIGAWHVKPGDRVREDQIVVDMITEKASVEVPSPVSGVVVSIAGQPGDKVPVGAELIAFETEPQSAAGESAGWVASQGEVRAPRPIGKTPGEKRDAEAAVQPPDQADEYRAAGEADPASGGRVMTSPAIRRRAQEAGIDLSQLQGSGPRGRILRQDLEKALAGSNTEATSAAEEIKVIGLRRVIAQRMSEAHRSIPHFTYVEEVDITELEALRRYLNDRQAKNWASKAPERESSGQEPPALTYLPFIFLALIEVLKDYRQCNAWYDAEREMLIRHRAVHIGVATQTRDGLKVPVIRDVGGKSLWELTREIRRVSELARNNTAKRSDLTGSTITVTSLGKLGGLASTPIINAPEVAIIGINKALERPMVVQGQIAIRRVMNLSSSFDHRFVDGHDAASMIQALKDRLEHPATIFIHRPASAMAPDSV
jgi:2-oxoisovalerate dehydrogenase E2 component (dihydrolipoyl transacylase)